MEKIHKIKQSIFLIFYYIEYDYIALSPDKYIFFLKNLCHILPNVNVFSRRHISFSFLLLKLCLKYIGGIKYINIYKKDYLFLDRLVLRDGYSSLLWILL